MWEPSLPRTFLGRLGAGSATTPRLPHSFYRGHGDHICLGTQPAHQCDACRVGIPPHGTTNQLHHPHHYYYHGYNEMTLDESECLNTADLLRTRSEYLWGVVQGWPPRSLAIPRQPRYTAGSWLYNGELVIQRGPQRRRLQQLQQYVFWGQEELPYGLGALNFAFCCSLVTRFP